MAAKIPVRVQPRIEVQYNPFSALQSIDVSYVGYGRYHGIEIDGNRRYLLADCVVTHNTVIALNIISRLKKDPKDGCMTCNFKDRKSKQKFVRS